jgi:NAD(P)H-hydrate repair Nnr-like enzyme with NAD(P)H-hydrate dehydratase domain
VVNGHGFDLAGDLALGGWKIVKAAPLFSAAAVFGQTLGEHWDDPGMDWTENWARAFLAGGETALLGTQGFVVSVAGGIAVDKSLDWQMSLMKKWIADSAGGWLYTMAPGLFGGRQSVITPEQSEVQRLLSSTNKKRKRDTGR